MSESFFIEKEWIYNIVIGFCLAPGYKLHTLYNNELKWILHLNANCEIIKLIKENKRKSSTGCGGNLLDTTPKAWCLLKNQNIGLPQN